MIYSSRFTVVLDACVLYPAPVRDFLLDLAACKIYKPKWTDNIHNEWKKSLLNNRSGIKEDSVNKTIERMNLASRTQT
jgi:hypothetical protein